MESNAAQFAAEFATHVPVYVIYLACIVLAIVLWKRAPLACGLACGSAVLLLLGSIVVMFVRQWHIAHMAERQMTHEELSRIFMVLAVIGSAVHTLGSGLLVTAVFVGRRAPARSAPSAV